MKRKKKMIRRFRYPDIALLVLLFYSKEEDIETFFPFLKEKKNDFSFVMSLIGGMNALAKLLGASFYFQQEQSGIVQNLMELGYSKKEICFTIDELLRKQFIKKAIITEYKLTPQGEQFLKNLSALARKRGRDIIKEVMYH